MNRHAPPFFLHLLKDIDHLISLRRKDLSLKDLLDAFGEPMTLGQYAHHLTKQLRSISGEKIISFQHYSRHLLQELLDYNALDYVAHLSSAFHWKHYPLLVQIHFATSNPKMSFQKLWDLENSSEKHVWHKDPFWKTWLALWRKCRNLLMQYLQAPPSRLLGFGRLGKEKFFLSHATLDPRWESEKLVQLAHQRIALDWMKTQQPSDSPTILDMGTGSGCLLISLLKRLPFLWGIGLDVSLQALETAHYNALYHQVHPRCRWKWGNWTRLLKPSTSPSFPLDQHPFQEGSLNYIISNPPYVERAYPLPPEVAKWDPIKALDGGSDGLTCYKTILPQGYTLLRPGGKIFLEIGCHQREALCHLSYAAGFHLVETFPDEDGKWRYLMAEKPIF